MANKLEAQISELERKATILEDIVEIINLQSKFNFYLEYNDTDKIVNELFVQDDPEVSCQIGDSGIYVGIESIESFWNARHRIQSIRGYLGTVMLETPHVQVSKDGKNARGIWHGFGPHSVPVTEPLIQVGGERANLEATWYMGKYQNEYVKENGKWKIKTMCALKYFQCPFDKSWVDDPDVYSFAPSTSECCPDKPGTYTPYDPKGTVSILPAAPEERGLTY